ncbi:phospholipase D-like domain-containing protein [Corynebacterium flavescens]|uniref:Cardiolipin synthase n=1 Tax=Corynebacterium flavescens TaxID=28028 RepID=A0A1L7CPB1_CORFL|nr:phospholipase D-like domain-containing protein [Corynebacterium flavescens]APT87680.1 cardiolipin synthase [Corynebacterium flavescens]KAA8720071.1 cardiolipin synthase A [Corynebacterium flavescens]MDN6198318.1 phospholipase D-like domain-containing protein [Corynebacterium flavescens]MDN6645851.1 phospholipase D-like domain-containing protein [Corynebacterium flavescens]GEB96927.1 cardiolipin synthase [Corynebacterium flavescens]
MTLSVDLTIWQLIFLIIDYTIKIIAIGVVPEGRRPSSSSAWLLAILLLPIVGLPLFLLMGSPSINRRRHRIQQEANELIEDVTANTPDHPSGRLSPEIESVIRLNRTLTGYPALIGHNQGLYADYESAIEAMAQAIDKAEHYVLIEVYIQSWDETTDNFYQSLARATARGVKVKLLLDQIGSIKYDGYSTLGKRLSAIGVEWHLTLPIQLHKARFRRPDLRNHRKLLIVDGHTGFIGSMNLIKREYRTTDRYWIDYMVKLTGPVVTSMTGIFAVDWYIESNETLELEALDYDDGEAADVNYLQLIPSGPGYTTEPNLRMFNSLVHHAKRRLVMVSPYFVPDESLLEAVTTACYRGVRVELYVSRKADQFMVNHAQSSYYQALLEAGMHIYQFPEPFVLHSKFVLTDPDDEEGDPLCMFGSSNMDMRSFGLNYESTMLVAKGDLIAQFNELAGNYRAVCHELTLAEWNERGYFRRYVDNAMRLTSALQ